MYMHVLYTRSLQSSGIRLCFFSHFVMPLSLLGQCRLMVLFSLIHKCINKGVLFYHITVLTLRIQKDSPDQIV